MEKIVEQGILYDFYGELLTEHQRRIYEDAVYNDMSLSEIAEQAGISRQGVHDLIRRCDRTLADYEEKLQLEKRFSAVQEKVKEHERLDEPLCGSDVPQVCGAHGAYATAGPGDHGHHDVWSPGRRQDDYDRKDCRQTEAEG